MKVLVAYETNAGSTEQTAETIAEVLKAEGAETKVCRFSQANDLESYDAAVIGAPVIVGWHRGAVRFVRRNQRELSRMPVAYFMTALTLTAEVEEQVPSFNGIQVYLDPSLLKQPKNPGHLSFRERHALLQSYITPVLHRAPAVRPINIGLFAGKLDYGKLKFLQMAFVLLLFSQKPRDYRNWHRIGEWAKRLYAAFAAAEQDRT